MTCGVYAITSPSGGQYIGSSNSDESRTKMRGRTVSDATRAKLSTAHMGLSNHNVPHSEATKKKLSEIRKVQGVKVPFWLHRKNLKKVAP